MNGLLRGMFRRAFIPMRLDEMEYYRDMDRMYSRF